MFKKQRAGALHRAHPFQQPRKTASEWGCWGPQPDLLLQIQASQQKMIQFVERLSPGLTQCRENLCQVTINRPKGWPGLAMASGRSITMPRQGSEGQCQLDNGHSQGGGGEAEKLLRSQGHWWPYQLFCFHQEIFNIWEAEAGQCDELADDRHKLVTCLLNLRLLEIQLLWEKKKVSLVRPWLMRDTNTIGLW